MKTARVDKLFLLSVVILVVTGFFIFNSASLGLLAKEGARYSNVAFSQTFYGLFLGTILCLITSQINYRVWRKYSLFLFIAALIATSLVFVPGLGMEFGGAKRWIGIASFSFQPSELLKLAYIIYVAAWISGLKKNAESFKKGILPLLVITAVTGAVILAQPDTDTFIVICMAGMAMLVASGASWKHILIIILISIAGFALVAYERPYIRDRLQTFINPSRDSLGSSYQIQQSLIAIGSGELFGRGFGQSIQKFNFLPEPIGDSIFAVMAEEFGFVGSVALVFMYLFFAFRGFKIVARAPDSFGGLLALGIVILILTQSFVNISAMLGILPLSGIPLLFVSHGGSAMLATLAEVGIILNISKYQRKTLH